MAAFFEEALGSAASGVFVHGSAALGGWTGSSDLDMLITSEVLDRDWLVIGRRLLSELATGPSVELTVVSAAAAARPGPPWPFLLHVNQSAGRVVTDGGRGDPDLVMHYLVTRDSGLAFTAQPVDTAIGAVQRAQVLDVPAGRTDLGDGAGRSALRRTQRLPGTGLLAGTGPFSRRSTAVRRALEHGIDAAIVEPPWPLNSRAGISDPDPRGTVIRRAMQGRARNTVSERAGRRPRMRVRRTVGWLALA